MRAVALIPLFVASTGWAQTKANETSRPADKAETSVMCTVRSIHALERDGDFDKRLTPLKRQLTRAPFSGYKTMKLLSVTAMKLGKGQKQSTRLPTGKVLHLTYRERLNAKEGLRLRMHLSIAPPKSKRFLPGTVFTIASGGTLLVAGDAHADGTLVVGITCVSR